MTPSTCVGVGQTVGGHNQAVFYKNESVTTLPTFVTTDTSGAYGLNDSGLAVGFADYASSGTYIRACKWTVTSPPYSFVALATLSGNSKAYAVNSSGTIVGYSYDGYGNKACSWDSAGVQHRIGSDFGSTVDSYANGINSTEDIVGKALFGTQYHGFKVTFLSENQSIRGEKSRSQRHPSNPAEFPSITRSLNQSDTTGHETKKVRIPAECRPIAERCPDGSRAASAHGPREPTNPVAGATFENSSPHWSFRVDELFNKANRYCWRRSCRHAGLQAMDVVHKRLFRLTRNDPILRFAWQPEGNYRSLCE
jgi:uncharacterized membrane protein